MEKIILEIEKLDHFGKGIGRINNIPVFVINALPQETVEINITKRKKNLMEAEVVNYIKKSNNRINPICPYYDRCGGCDLMHLSYEEQLTFKENKIREIMTKFDIDTSIKPIITTDSLNYRNKITLKVNKKLGYFKKKSYEIIEINECLIANKKINEILKELNTIDLNGIEEIIIRSVCEGDMVVLLGNKQPKFNKLNTVDSLHFNYKKMCGKDYIVDKIKDKKFIISPKSFFQVNHDGMINLYDKVLDYCGLKGQENILDLYCGTGTIGIYLSDKCNKVLGIEINEDAIRDANYNKKLNDLNNVEFIAGDVKKVLKKTNFKPDIIVVDPPRAGLDIESINHLNSLNCKKIVYVSCDPMTLARDLKLLQAKYIIDELTPVDMFSNTYHVECVVSLSLRS